MSYELERFIDHLNGYRHLDFVTIDPGPIFTDMASAMQEAYKQLFELTRVPKEFLSD